MVGQDDSCNCSDTHYNAKRFSLKGRVTNKFDVETNNNIVTVWLMVSSKSNIKKDFKMFFLHTELGNKLRGYFKFYGAWGFYDFIVLYNVCSLALRVYVSSFFQE